MMPNQSCGQLQRGQQVRTVPPRSAYAQQQSRTTSPCAQQQSRTTSSCTQSQSRTTEATCQNDQMSQEQLLRLITLTKFAMVDANLYLDTHPDDEEAIRYFQVNSKLYGEAMENYAKAYGPLTISHAHHNDKYWDWVNQPWPWQ